ncbi:restriction endonuclease subunit S [Vagococcus fluvialis]|uniref:Restriction endonuclease subunit S n=2 Tax=Vagococcus fluvialis TaxID=2738 RepID=A0A7X6I494_9ENTE|nr:restriction endonuclease subunit S [Vagococcus fluvialis]
MGVTNKIGSGKTPKGGNEVYLSKGIPLLRSQNIYSDKVNLEDIVFISEEINNIMKNSTVKKNDILLNITGASIGRSAVYSYSEEANVNQHVCIIRPKNNISSNFIQLNLTSRNGQNQIDMNQAGGGREGLNFQQISKFKFKYPEIKEQTKIGNFFKQLDESITLQEQQLEKLKEMKKGYLQQMFI